MSNSVKLNLEDLDIEFRDIQARWLARAATLNGMARKGGGMRVGW